MNIPLRQRFLAGVVCLLSLAAILAGQKAEPERIVFARGAASADVSGISSCRTP